MGKRLDNACKVRRSSPWVLRDVAQAAAAEDEDELRNLLREGVVMLEGSWGNTETVCADLERSGQTTLLDDGTVSYGQPWDWLRKAKAVLG